MLLASTQAVTKALGEVNLNIKNKKNRAALTSKEAQDTITHIHTQTHTLNTGLLAWHKLAHQPGNWPLNTLHSSTAPEQMERE